MTNYGLVYVGGLVRYVFNLESDCVNDTKYRVKVTANGGAFGGALDISGTFGTVELQDNNATPDPYALEGYFEVVSGGFAWGFDSEVGRRIGKNGGGYGAYFINMGDAEGMDHGFMEGLELGGHVVIGSSLVDKSSIEKIDCVCNN